MPVALTITCDQRDPATEADYLSTTVDTVGSVVRVTNTGTPPEWRLVPVVSIGPKTLTDQETPEEFGSVSAVAPGPNGTVFVADAQKHEIRVFGLDGAHIRTFGRNGGVPAVPYKDRTVPVFRGEHLATIRQDDLDLDHVDVWRAEQMNP